jgi:putative tryptophan/tyrosine transport system substrate-binding protein
MKRREIIALFWSAAIWPLAARAQQSAMPVVGYLSTRTPKSDEPMLTLFREGLAAVGYVENKNVAIEYRFADGRYDQMPLLAADLVRRKVTVIAAITGPSAQAAKSATRTIPIVFSIAGNPVEEGLVKSLSRPGGNITGVSNLGSEAGAKRWELLREMVPTAKIVALLINPTSSSADSELKAANAVTAALGLELHVLHASSERDFDSVFDDLDRQRAGALVISTDPFFTSRSEQLATLALRHAVPAIFRVRAFAVAGGLMSYSGSLTEAYRLVGNYVARILKGERPGDLPAQQVTKLELIINLKTAKALGLTVPPSVLAIADEVIE